MQTREELRQYCLQEIQSGSTLSDSWADLYSLAVFRELESLVRSGELYRLAQERGVSPNVVMLEIGRELERPLEEVQERARVTEENRFKAEVAAYARENRVSFPEAARAVREGGV